MPRLLPVRALPWAILLEVAVVARNHWSALPERDRERLTKIVRDSKGRPDKLTKKERDDLRRIVGKLDFGALAKDLVPFMGPARRGRKR